MSKKILAELEGTILETMKRINRRKNGPSADMMKSLAALVSSYRKLNESLKSRKRKMTDEDGDPGYYDKLLGKE